MSNCLGHNLNSERKEVVSLSEVIHTDKPKNKRYKIKK